MAGVRFHMRIASAIVLIMLSGCASPDPKPLVSFWKGAEDVPSEVVVHDHPCGEAVSIATDHVPKDHAWIETDVAYEISPSGGIVREWRTPIDLYPIDLVGNSLVLAYGSNPKQALWVGPDGGLQLKPLRAAPEASRTVCPEAFTKFEASDYAFCTSFERANKRVVAHQAPCT